MLVVVTRPEREARPWTAQLAARGHEVLALPLIAIAPAPDGPALQRARDGLAQYGAAMFVSAAAVQGFFGSNEAAARTARALHAIETRAWATGPGTAQALLDAGFPTERIDQPPPDAPQFDSEALWDQVRPQVRAGLQVLVVRGAGADGQPAGREWLAERLLEAGAQVHTVAAYRRGLPAWTPAQRQAAVAAARDGSVWLFSSSEALANLRALLPQQDWSQARAIATHPRIGQAARDAGFGVVCPSRPGVEALAATLESFA